MDYDSWLANVAPAEFATALSVELGAVHLTLSPAAYGVYLLFTVIYWAADGKDFFNNPYIYRALSWERPMSAGKLVMLILFVLCPCFNCLFWFLIWARRRVLVAAKTPSVLS